MSKATTRIFCERCGTNTPHKAKPFLAPSALPTATKLIDLTGGFAPLTDEYKEKGLVGGEHGIRHTAVPNATQYTCTKCGTSKVTVGPSKSGGVFDRLRRGEGF